jgi:hypothetical protein
VPAGPAITIRKVAPRAAAALLVALAALGACTPAEQGATPAPTDGTAATTTTLRPPPSPEHPLRVSLAGDSVMAGLVPPMLAAFDASGAAEGRFLLTPSILRDPAVRFSWRQQVEEFGPEIVVVLMGTWEAMIMQGQELPGVAAPGTPEWAATYRSEILEPWIDVLTNEGVDVVWVGMPPLVADNATAAHIASLNQLVEAIAAERDDLVYVAPRALVDAEGRALETVELRGEAQRLRQIDGLHLCPAGAELLAVEVLAALEAATGLPQVETWRGDHAWEQIEASPGTPTYTADGCPPV